MRYEGNKNNEYFMHTGLYSDMYEDENYLEHYKYIDKIRLASGKWKYVYSPKVKAAINKTKETVSNAANSAKEAVGNAVNTVSKNANRTSRKVSANTKRTITQIKKKVKQAIRSSQKTSKKTKEAVGNVPNKIKSSANSIQKNVKKKIDKLTGEDKKRAIKRYQDALEKNKEIDEPVHAIVTRKRKNK